MHGKDDDRKQYKQGQQYDDQWKHKPQTTKHSNYHDYHHRARSPPDNHRARSPIEHRENRYERERSPRREPRSPPAHSRHSGPFLENAPGRKAPPLTTQNRYLLPEGQREQDSPNTRARKRPHEENGEEEVSRKKPATQ
ncbi:hypothetical protein FKM82_030440 [Ascaphus truei]